MDEGRGLTESQLFQGSALGFGIQEIDEEHLECNPTTIDSEEFPVNSIKRNGVDVV
jgi:hypothetical protein